MTSTIELATGVLLLPEHNPVICAKQAATLDVLSGGRFTLGVGIGWSVEEFAALGVPFAGRGRRTTEYVAAMRRLWSDDVASFSGDFTAFESVRVNPKPVRGRRIPVVIGGNSDAALARVAAFGDGWYGFNVPAETVAGRVAALAQQCERHERSLRDLSVAVAVAGGTPAMLPALAEIGVTEFVVVSAPPPGPAAAAADRTRARNSRSLSRTYRADCRSGRGCAVGADRRQARLRDQRAGSGKTRVMTEAAALGRPRTAGRRDHALAVRPQHPGRRRWLTERQGSISFAQSFWTVNASHKYCL